MVCDCNCSDVNLAQKVLDMYSRLQTKMNLKNELLKNIAISIKTNSGDIIEPAFIVKEDDVFLDIEIIDMSTDMLRSVAVRKNQIQSIMLLGYRGSDEDVSKIERDFEEVLLDIIESIPDEYLISVKEKPLDRIDL